MAYNFQLHHVPFALNSVRSWWALHPDRDVNQRERQWRPPRLRLTTKEIRNVHFSGDVKLWHVFLRTVGHTHRESLLHERATLKEEDFVRQLLRSCCWGYENWENGTLLAPGTPRETTELVDRVYDHLRALTRKALSQWGDCADKLIEQKPSPIRDLLSPEGADDTDAVET